MVASGGNLQGSNSYRLGDTAGQPAASGATALVSANYMLSGGFWAQITGTVPITSTPPTPTPTPTPSGPTPTPTPTPTPQPGGFGLSINDGDLYTSDPSVTVTLAMLAALLVGAAQVGALDGVLAPAAQSNGSSFITIDYQGCLADSSGNPLDGTYGMSFSLWDAASGGSLIWGPESHTAVPVSDGLFSVGLGSRTGGGIPTSTWNGDRYLEITIGGETLSPRELIRGVPIAGMALTVADGAITQAQAPTFLYRHFR